MDTLCVGPSDCTREMFFSSLKERLQEDVRVTDLQAVEEASVPVIKMEFDGFDIDLVYARVTSKILDDKFDPSDNSHIENASDHDERSLNGSCPMFHALHFFSPESVLSRLLPVIAGFAGGVL
jgi:poly(A) polymerase